MSLDKIGQAKAHLGGSKYVTIGAIFKDEEGKMVFKVDSLPLPQSGWLGWVNVFLDNETPRKTKKAPERDERQGNLKVNFDDDIPF